MKPELNIFIPTWNNADMLLGCLGSIVTRTEAPYHIHVLNNGDTKDNEGITFKEFIREKNYPEELVSVHDMGENLGWQGALNKAWEMGLMDTPQTMVLNDDTIIVPCNKMFVRGLMGYIGGFPEVGAVGPTTNVVMGSQNFMHMSLNNVHTTSLLIGFCCLFRTEALEKIWDRSSPGPWDADLPGGDDLDISIRLRRAGYQLLVARDHYIHHIGFQTGQRVHGQHWNSDKQRLDTDNALIKKHSVKEWFQTMQSQVGEFTPVHATFDGEGEYINDQVGEGLKGLDLGVGSNKTVKSSIGVDRVPAGVRGQTGGRRGIPSVAEVNADVTDLPFDDNSQDYLVARHLLEHIVNIPQALTEWRRVLKPEGVLLVACPNHHKGNTIIMDSEHVHAFTPEGLVPILHAFGFTCVGLHDPPHSVGFTIKAVKRTLSLAEAAGG